jgi:D-glycero-D-manno-heptose 1,7-bisphosphate phosphatase
MNKAVLLDRDGVLNKEREEYNFRLEDFEILPDIVPALKLLRERGYLLIVISNQSGIGRGLFKVADVEMVHRKLKDYLKEHGLYLDEMYYCTHHPESGNCICRKPDSLLVEKALARFKADPAQSYFIGDKERDVLAGKKVGVEGILIPSNLSLLEAIQPILNRK